MIDSVNKRLLQIENVSKKIADFPAVNMVNLSVLENEKIAIIGENGAGKSTLLKLIAGLEQPDTGNIYYQGKKVLGPNYKLIPGHNKIAYLSQHFELLNHYFIKDILSYKNELDEKQAKKVIEICNIKHLLERKPHQLSGGEKQRIAFARQLYTNPNLLLLDEPFSNMDMIHKNDIRKMLHEISIELNISIMMVTHDSEEAISWADRICIMKNGSFIQDNTPNEVYHRPANKYSAELLGIYDVLPSKIFFHYFKTTHDPINIEDTILLRPSYFRIESPGKHTVACKIENILFKGTHLLLTISHETMIFHVISDNLHLHINDIIHISFIKNDHYFLNS